MTNKFEACTNAVKEAQNQELLDFVARRLYEMAAVCIMSQDVYKRQVQDYC